MSAVAELDPIRSRLVALGRAHTAHDVAEAMRAEGRVVTDAVLIETVEALRRVQRRGGPARAAAPLAGCDRRPRERS